VKPVNQFFSAIDDQWESAQKGKITLSIIGSAALFLQIDCVRGTKDLDVLETPEISPDISKRLLEVAGKGSSLYQRSRMYLDIVKNPIPFLPQRPIFHPVSQLRKLKHFKVQALDIIDVVVSKLKPFRAQDVNDIRSLVDMKQVPHKRFLNGTGQ